MKCNSVKARWDKKDYKPADFTGQPTKEVFKAAKNYILDYYERWDLDLSVMLSEAFGGNVDKSWSASKAPPTVTTIRIDANLPWKCFTGKGGHGIGVCDALKLTVQAETWAELMEGHREHARRHAQRLTQVERIRGLPARPWLVGTRPNPCASSKRD